MPGKHPNNYPKLHNATWPGLVGKGSPGAEPAIDLDTMIRLTVEAEHDGVRFDGIDLFLYEPHFSIDAADDDIRRLADKVRSLDLNIGSVVAPVWPGTGGGEAIGSGEDRARFLGQVRKACRIAGKFRELGVRPYGVVRIDSATSVDAWSHDPEGSQERIARTFRDACDIAEEYDEKLAAEGEICWGGMHSWKRMLQLLEMVNRPATLGLQADMAHTLLYLPGYNAPEDALLPGGFDWQDRPVFDEAYGKLASILRPWTIDFHVAQNDATVFGSGTHDKTGRHCRPGDPGGKLDIVRHAGYWLRDERGGVTRKIRHLCWDGCMFPNAVMMQPQTWIEILAAMVRVRDAHGWKA
jgi:sugar phosphate isomerase/epimerase